MSLSSLHLVKLQGIAPRQPKGLAQQIAFFHGARTQKENQFQANKHVSYYTMARNIGVRMELLGTHKVRLGVPA